MESDGTERETVPADDLRELVDKWTQYRDECQEDADGLDYNAGMAEGAESAARELKRVIEMHTGGSWVFECTECGERWVDPPAPVSGHYCNWSGHGLPPEDAQEAEVEAIAKPSGGESA